MRKILVLFFILIPIMLCSGVEIISDLPSERWVEIESGDPLIVKTYIVKPDRNDVNIMVMVEEYPPDSKFTIEQVMDNYKTGLMTNDLFKDGDYKRELNVKMGDNVWGILKFRKKVNQFNIFHDSFIVIRGNAIIYVTFFTLVEEDYLEYSGEVKSFLEKIEFK